MKWIDKLDEQARETARTSEKFLRENEAQLDLYRGNIVAGLREAVAELRSHVERTSGNDPYCHAVLKATADYVHWMEWAFGDLPFFAIATRPHLESLRRNAGACGLIYVAGRILDDFLDRHFIYRKQTTLLGALKESGAAEPDGMSVVAVLMLCFEGLANLAPSPEILRKVLDANRRALVGVMLERTGRENWNPQYYERLVELKNVDYWRVLYSAVDPNCSSPLYPFLCAYYTFAQKLNDVQGHTRDEAQGIPNLLTIHRDAAEDELGNSLVALFSMARDLPEPERGVALLKVGETQAEAMRQGLFRAPVQKAATRQDYAGLLWHSRLEEFLERLGPEALETVPCPVCGGADARDLCRAQGFLLNRCTACEHVYVSPRLRPEVQLRMEEAAPTNFTDPFLNAQKLSAEFLCRLLRQHASGPRLLDIGFGSGHLLSMARAYAFQVYGIDGSPGAIENLAPMFGRRLAQFQLGDTDLPWGSFDVAVMSHVIEHLPAPGLVLEKVHKALNRNGILYVAAPDIESLQFQVFGNRWDAINPIAHYQFFREASLGRLLRDSGFEVIGRVRHPPAQGPGQARWMRLFRQLGGDESGELAMLARAIQ